MAKIILFTSGKGGTGKTVCVANLGAALAQRGRNVLLVDLDLGYRNLDLPLGLQNQCFHHIGDVINGQTDLHTAGTAQEKAQEHLYLLAAPVTMTWEDVTEEMAGKMQNLLQSAQDEYDYILLDGPARIPTPMMPLMKTVDETVLVITPETASIRAAEHEKMRFMKAKIRHMHLLVNRYDPGMVAEGGKMGYDDIEQLLSLDLYGVIPEEQMVSKCANRGQLVIQTQPMWDSSMAFERIAGRIEGEEIPYGILETYE